MLSTMYFMYIIFYNAILFKINSIKYYKERLKDENINLNPFTSCLFFIEMTEVLYKS